MHFCFDPLGRRQFKAHSANLLDINIIQNSHSVIYLSSPPFSPPLLASHDFRKSLTLSIKRQTMSSPGILSSTAAQEKAEDKLTDDDFLFRPSWQTTI